MREHSPDLMQIKMPAVAFLSLITRRHFSHGVVGHGLGSVTGWVKS